MDKITVRAVHRISLPTDSYGRITPGSLHCEDQPFSDGATVVLEVGDGWWIQASDLEHIRFALSNVGHISITGRFTQRGGGTGQFGIIYGIGAIASRLAELLQAPPLYASA